MIQLPEVKPGHVPVVADGPTVTVRATKPGYSAGPRAAGDVFDMPLNKDGSKPKGSWFVLVEPPKPGVKSAKAAQDDSDLA